MQSQESSTYFEHEFEEIKFINDAIYEAKSRSSTLYSHKSEVEKTKLEDFQTIRIVGKGSYGKVYLVKNQNTGNLYAMKIIRKDLLID